MPVEGCAMPREKCGATEMMACWESCWRKDFGFGISGGREAHERLLNLVENIFIRWANGKRLSRERQRRRVSKTYLQGRQPALETAFPKDRGLQASPQSRGCCDNRRGYAARSVRMWTTRRRGRCRLWRPHAEDIAAPLMFFGCKGRQLREHVNRNEPTYRWSDATQTLSTFLMLVCHSQSNSSSNLFGHGPLSSLPTLITYGKGILEVKLKQISSTISRSTANSLCLSCSITYILTVHNSLRLKWAP